MLSRVIEFCKSNKHVLLWTVGYFVATWAIMRFMFNFDIFSRIRWYQLVHAHIRGFAGMVFGILILAAVPMYIATTIVIARTKSPLFSINIPQCIKTFIKNAFVQTPMDEQPQETPCTIPSATPTPESQSETTTDTNEQTVPETVPNEMRVAYARAHKHLSRTPVSAFDLSNVTKLSQSLQQSQMPTQSPENDMPIPSDFDIDDTDSIVDDIPHFTNIDFDDEDDTPIELNDIQSVTETTEIVAKYLESKSVPYTIDGDVVITDKFAIVSHTDSDFWVADNESWFAAGKTRKSPIELVKHIAATNNIKPVLYLGATNIMDIDALVAQWQNDGISVITDLKDLK